MYALGNNIISSLGFTTDENFNAVKQGISGVKHDDANAFGLPEDFWASLIDRERLNDEFVKISPENRYTDLEKAAILSVSLANNEAQIDLSGENTIFILSTTKGNIELLALPNLPKGEGCSPLTGELVGTYLWHTAELIAGFFKNPNTPIVVSNACISGAAAQIAAMRELQSENYENAVVVGADFLSKFIISGFQSFKALSPKHCRPFDKDRCGLNLGEAAATMIYGKNEKTIFRLVNGMIRNDANHISAPSRTGEGSFRALRNILQDIDMEQIAFVNAHGTATSYNDAAEVNAIVRAGLDNVPVNSLKAFFGHTLGTAGVLESIISIRALAENMVLKSMNFNEQNFENRINISLENQFSNKKYFVKMLSGFGGGNAVLLFEKIKSELHE